MDFETASKTDLREKGVYNYAACASTHVLCLAYTFDDDDEEIRLWTPDTPFPTDLAEYIRSGGMLYAFNAAFERLIFEYVMQDYGAPIPKLEQWYCVAAQARANCLPGNLMDAGRAISSRMQKDFKGAELIRKLSIPRADGTFNRDPALMEEMRLYCQQDVRTQREIRKRLRPLSAQELHDYHVNERINDRGLGVDVELCHAAVRYAEQETIELQQEVVELTNGGVVTVRSPRLREWVLAHVGPQGKELMKTYKDGRVRWSIDKSVRANLLALAEENADEVPEVVAEVVRCTDALWASSVAKFSKLASLADDEDARIRGAFVFAGGSATGRHSSYGAQLHNMSRKCAEDPNAVRAAMVRGHSIAPTYGKRVTDVLRGMLRPALIPAKGNVIIALDWAGIEARVNPWLSNSREGEKKLDLFRTGGDVYKVNAAATFGCAVEDVDKNQRQIGKVQELALGFLGGVGAFASMGKVYGVVVNETEARKMVDGWRKANPWAMPYGKDVERAYYAAMRNPGKEIPIRRTCFLFSGGNLWYILPSGRVLNYPLARFNEAGDILYLKAAFKPKADATEWPTATLWPGLSLENLTQATANDLLRNTCRILDADGIKVIGHVHDEVIIECKASEADAVLKRAEEVMTTPPTWASGLPLAVEGAIMERYGK